MSRPPIRDVFRLARLGLDKVALACAAFSLMHASARAAEAPAAEAVSIDQWAAQSSDQVARRSINDDAWVNLSAAHVAQESLWNNVTSDLAKRFYLLVCIGCQYWDLV